MATHNGAALPAQDAPAPVKQKSGFLDTGTKLGMTGFKASKTCCGGFCDFLLKGNVVELAVAFVIAQATVALVQAIVRDIITPLIAAIWGGVDFSELYFTVNKSRFNYGDLVNNALSFLVICLVVYFIFVVPMNIAKARLFPKQDERECPECLTKIDARAVRCKFCTVAVPPVEVVVDGKKAVHPETGAELGTVKRRGCCCLKTSTTT